MESEQAASVKIRIGRTSTRLLTNCTAVVAHDRLSLVSPAHSLEIDKAPILSNVASIDDYVDAANGLDNGFLRLSVDECTRVTFVARWMDAAHSMIFVSARGQPYFYAFIYM